MFHKKELDIVADNVSMLATELSKFTKQLVEVKNMLAQQDDRLARLEKATLALSEKKDGVIAKLDDACVAVDATRNSMEKSVRSFVLHQQTLNDAVFNKLHLTIKDETAKLTQSTSQYNTLKKDIHDMVTHLDDAKKEFVKFESIAKLIKEKDFSLTSFGTLLKKEEKEKFHLLQENERLKQLIAKSRRRV